MFFAHAHSIPTYPPPGRDAHVHLSCVTQAGLSWGAPPNACGSAQLLVGRTGIEVIVTFPSNANSVEGMSVQHQWLQDQIPGFVGLSQLIDFLNTYFLEIIDFWSH